MVIETDLKANDDDVSKIELFVNTSDFTDEDFKKYLNICEKIQYNEQMRNSMQRRRSSSAMITATMTREEIFECSTLDEDGFLNALEYQNSYKAPPLRDLNLSQSMTEAMQYFDEDVIVDSGSSTAHTPVKQQQSKVATILSNCKIGKESSTPSPPTRRQKWNPVMKTSSKIQELKNQYEAVQLISSRSPKKIKSPKALRKSMVKQLAKIFSSKDSTTTAADSEQQKNIKTRAARAFYRPQLLPSPVQSPRSKRKQSTKTHCLVSEQVFKQLSVKDIASLFNKYSHDENTSNGENLNELQKPKQTKSRRRFARGEVINEKQAPVKQLTQELEAKSIVLQQTSKTPRNLKNNSTINETKLANSSIKKTVVIGKDENLKKPSRTNRNVAEVTADEGFAERDISETAVSTELNVFLKPSDIKQNVNTMNQASSTTKVSTPEATTARTIISSVDEAISREAKSFSLSKLKSDEPRSVEFFGGTFNKASKCEPIRSAKPKRKRKMRRILMWKPELSMVEAKPVQSTDSEFENNTAEISAPVKINNFYDSIRNNVDKVNIKHYVPKFDALNESIRLKMGSTLKVGASYSLSIVFSDYLIGGVYGSVSFETSHCELSRSCPSLVETSLQVELLEVKAEIKLDNFEKPILSTELPIQLTTQPSTESAAQESTQAAKLIQSNVSRKLMNSYVDQATFEIGSKDLKTTLPTSTANESQKLNKTEASLLTLLANEMAESSKTNEKYPSGFSTPVKGHLQQGSSDEALEKLDLSPILVTPTKSSNETPTKLNTIDHKANNMEQSLECEKNYVSVCGLKPGSVLPKLSTSVNSRNAADMEKASSAFWINTGDFCVSLDIYHNSAERLSLLYDIFSQKSYESRAISFGIDEEMFFAKDSITWSNIRAHFPSIKNCSHYWFASGDMTLPFMGKFLLPEKIKRLFNIVREAVEESGTLRFGIDGFDFSSVPTVMCGKTFISTAIPKTTSDAMTTSINSNSIRTSDLDHTEFDSEASIDLPLSTTSLSNNYSGSISMDSAHFTLPQNGQISLEYPSLEYEEERSLSQHFEDAIDQSERSNEDNGKWISKPLHMVETQQQKLKAVEQRIHFYANSTDLRPLSNELENFKDSPGYVCELQEIIAAIIDIGQVTGFKNCSLHQLESFTYFLSHYADICLDSCLEHMDRILQALKEKRELKA